MPVEKLSEHFIPSPGWFANLLRPIVLEDEMADSYQKDVSIPRAVLTSIYQHLEDYAASRGEVTDGARAAAEMRPLQISTPDPRFDPEQAVEINGYRFIPDANAG